MSIIPTKKDNTGVAAPTGLMVLVQSWLADLPVDHASPHRQQAALRRELDAFAWTLVGRLDGIAPPDDALRREIPLDIDKPNR